MKEVLPWRKFQHYLKSKKSKKSKKSYIQKIFCKISKKSFCAENKQKYLFAVGGGGGAGAGAGAGGGAGAYLTAITVVNDFC